MLFTAHTLSGGAGGELIGNPFLAFLFGFCIHFVLDAIPHYDTTDNGKYTLRQILLISIDSGIGLTVLFILFKQAKHPIPLIFGSFGGVAPDLLSQIPFIRKPISKLKIGKAFYKFHSDIQRVKLSPLPGILIQVVVWIISIWILIVVQ